MQFNTSPPPLLVWPTDGSGICSGDRSWCILSLRLSSSPCWSTGPEEPVRKGSSDGTGAVLAWVSDPSPCPGVLVGLFGLPLWHGVHWGIFWDLRGEHMGTQNMCWVTSHTPLFHSCPGKYPTFFLEGPLSGRLPSPVSFSEWLKSKHIRSGPGETGCTFASLLTPGSLQPTARCQPLPLGVSSLLSDSSLNSPLLAWGLGGEKKTPKKTCQRNLLWIKSLPCLISAGGWWLLMVRGPV